MLSHISRFRITPGNTVGHMYRLCIVANSKLFLLPLNRSPFPSGLVHLHDRKYSEFRQMYSQFNKYIDKLLNRNDNVESEDASTHKWGKSIIIKNAASETEAEPIHTGELLKNDSKISEEVISPSSIQPLKSVEHSVETAKMAANGHMIEENTDAEVIMFSSSKDDGPKKGKDAPSDSKPSPISQQMEILMPEEGGKSPMAKKPQDVTNHPPPISQQMEVQVDPKPHDAGKGPQITSAVQSPQELVTHGAASHKQDAGKVPETPISKQMEPKPHEVGKGPQIISSVQSPQKLVTQGTASHKQEAENVPKPPPLTKGHQEPGSQSSAPHLVSTSPAGQPGSLTQDQAKPNIPEAPASGKLLQDPATNVLATESNLHVSPLPSTNPEGDPNPSGPESDMKTGAPEPGPDEKGTEEEHPVFFKTKDELVQILKEINDRINDYEMRMENLKEQPLVEEISMEEYCDIARHPLRTDEGTESFWPHTEEEQKIGAFGIAPVDELAIEAKPLLTEQELQQFEEKMAKMDEDDGAESDAPGGEGKKDTPAAAKQEVPLHAKQEISQDSPKPQGPSDEAAPKK